MATFIILAEYRNDEVDGPSGNRSLSDRAVRLGGSRARPDEAGEPLKRVAVHALMRKFAPGEGASDDTLGAQVRDQPTRVIWAVGSSQTLPWLLWMTRRPPRQCRNCLLRSGSRPDSPSSVTTDSSSVISDPSSVVRILPVPSELGRLLTLYSFLSLNSF